MEPAGQRNKGIKYKVQRFSANVAFSLRTLRKFFFAAQLPKYYRKVIESYLFIIIIFVLVSCDSKEKKIAQQQKQKIQLPQLPEFNSDSAYAYVKAQIDFGPRVPNTKAHLACGDYLIRKMKGWCDTVIVQSGTLKTFDNTTLNFRNVISSFNPESKRRVLFFAHWDTRPWSDQDTIDTDKPSLGADDGASGVAVLMEIARLLHINKPDLGIDLAFFDAEDWGKEGGGPGSEDSYALGTQYWANNPHTINYTADYGILLDMVGGKNARFRKEGSSVTHPPSS